MAPPGPGGPLAAWLSYAEALHPAEIVLGLERVGVVADALDLLPCAPRTVLVGGTNGKGSCAAMLSAILRARELRVGTYLSPHLWRYTERILIQGEEVTEAWACEAFAVVDAARDGVPLTYFEFGTLVAMWLFREAVLDVAVLEVGLGGRLDATNIVSPDVSLITSIGLDHMDWLGPDREAIGREKAGILRAGLPAVIGEPAPPESLRCIADTARTRWIGRDFSAQPGTDGGWTYSADVTWDLPALTSVGAHQLGNAACAITAARLLEPTLTRAAVVTAMEGIALPGRLQVAAEQPRVILDVGHNPEAAAALAVAVDGLAPRPRIAVLGMMRDKDIDGFVGALADRIDAWVVVDLPTDRAATAGELAAVIQARGSRVLASATDPTAGLALARAAVGASGSVLVLGSFHCAGSLPPAGLYSGA